MNLKGAVQMAIIFITGLSGVGKSTVLEQLGREGYHVVDTDYNYVRAIKNGATTERVWDEEKIINLIKRSKQSHLFISGCYSNQSKFYRHFKHVVLLKAELDVMLERVTKRTTNSYGKSAEEMAEIIEG